MEFKNKKLEEFNNYIKNKQVALLGMGISNIPLIDYLYEKQAKITLFDSRPIEEISQDVKEKIEKYKIPYSFGKDYLKKLMAFDLIFRSPSCLPTMPELVREESKGTIVTTEIELVIKMCPCKVIGITGSEGKTTTTTLISEIIKKSGKRYFLGGNIGIPLFTEIENMRPDDIVILELSSFQLMGMEVSPDISIITNITPNHLNIHKNYEEYIAAKKNIFKYQDENGILILNNDNEVTKKCGEEAPGKVIYFSSKEKLDNGYILDNGIIKECNDGLRQHIVNVKDIKVKGTHNYENAMAALAAVNNIINIEDAINVIKEFSGVEHRLELIKDINGIKWYNDSASTSPTRTIAALNGFTENIILIAGGSDKNLDYTPLARPVLEHVKKLILIGETANKICDVVKKEADEQHKNIEIHMCDSLSQTVSLSKRFATKGDVVLFSPASASFDMFKNMYDRGEQFKKLVI